MSTPEGTVAQESRKPNRLADALSPYLKQHAMNPVDWYPWGEEALSRARDEDKPILLSVGYSACHWCHVMERESFENPLIAAQMNTHFVCVKVDREERPDLDQIYQTVAQMMGRSGGWPLTVFLTPELKPFFAGTYFPPESRHGMPGFPNVIQAIREAYAEKRDEVEDTAKKVTEAVASFASEALQPDEASQDFLTQAAAKLEMRFDQKNGGFGGHPKFPNTMSLETFLRAHARDGEAKWLGHTRRALDGMRDGGIHDHLGGGFHRYTVDGQWQIPHFEKMLYDNALFARLYLDAWRVTGEESYRDTVRTTLDYVLRDMRSAEGGFFSAEDADSEGEEGKFFVWKPSEVIGLLGEADAQVACIYYGVVPGGNFEKGTTVLHVTRPVEALAEQTKKPVTEVRAALARAREKLLAARSERVRPFRDEKHIASWNGLMIGAMAEAGAALGEARYLEAATSGLTFIRKHLMKDGALLRIEKDGRAHIDGFLEDHGAVAHAALDVYEATMDGEALAFAEELARIMLERFWDDDKSAFFFAPAEGTDRIVRAKDHVDNATPSGASLACHTLLRLHGHTGDVRALEVAERALKGLTAIALRNPMGFGNVLGALGRLVHGPTHVVVVAETGDAGGDALLAEARRAYIPNRVLARVAPGSSGEAAKVISGQGLVDGKAAAYVCRDRTCSPPVTTAEALRALLREGSA